jgi:hypothetical protein
MPPPPSPESGAPRLPEPLLLQFRAFEKRLRRLETVTAVGGALLGLAATFGLLYASDRLWETPGWVRLLLSVAGAAAVSWGGVFWFKRWVVARRGPRDLARLIQRGMPEVGDRLLGVVELTDGSGLPEGVSPALARAAIAQVGRQAERVDFQRAAASRLPRRIALASAALVAVAAVPFVFAPNAARNALQRLFNPLGDVRRFTFVSLEDLPNRLVVPHGDPFAIEARLAPASERRPPSAQARFEDQPPLDAPFADGVAAFQVPGQTREGRLTVRAGDAAKRIRVVPAHRPELVEMAAEVRLPEYLSRDPETRALHGSSARLLEGSTASFLGRVSRDIVSAQVREDADLAVDVRGREFATPSLPAESGRRLTFHWRDGDGLEPARPFALEVETFADAPPEVEFREVSRTLAILPDEVATLPVRAEDDFGLRRFAVEWTAARADGQPGPGPAPAASASLGEGGPTQTRLDGSFTFSPLVAKVPEDHVVTVTARAQDYHPGRGETVSVPVKIFVLNPAAHARMVQDQMERLLAQMEELAREEENLQTAHESMQARPEAQLAGEEAMRELKEGRSAEERHQRRLENLAREAEKIMQEALRNQDIPESTLREMNEVAQGMREVSAGEMQEAAEALARAAQQPEKRREELAKAAAKEKEAVKKMRQMERQVDRSIEDMLAQNFVNRLRAAAAVEKGIAEELAAAVPEILGQLPEEMPEDKRALIAGAADRQLATRVKAGHIQDDLGGFYNRTRKEEYGVILKEMAERKTTASLEQISGFIRENLAGKSIPGAQKWERQFTAWADMLESARKQNDQEGEESDPEKVDLEVLIALMRARHLEEGIREQTRLLDESRAANAAYATDARRLARHQFGVSDEVGRLENRIRQDKLRQLAAKVSGEMMNVGVRLRAPATDQETIGIQTEIIELLASLIDQSESSQSSAGQSMMAAMGLSNRGGGSLAGGGTHRPATPATGGAGGGRPEERAGARGSGLAAEVPEEFRAALEAFHQGLENTP